VKKDLLIALGASVITAGICFGLARMKPDFGRPASVMASAPAAAGKADRVVMHVNGEPVTETEFQVAFAQMPEDVQRQFASEQGKQAFAEQVVRLKLLEQEGRKLGVERDPRVVAQLAADRMNIVAAAAAQKLVATPSPAAVQKFYSENQKRFETMELSHILVAYQGGGVPARAGTAPSQAEAMQKAAALRQQIDKGADFAQLAAKYSDDMSSAEHGGQLGPFGPGMLPPEIESRVFALQPGQVTPPIPSRFGIHIFKAGKRTAQPLEQVREGIARRVQQQNTLDRVEALRKTAKVDFDPKFFPNLQPKAPPKQPS
jgi:hypothetical protein